MNKNSETHIAGEYQVIVIGGGHAGCEAALAAARMGLSTLLISLNLESMALTPCNPAIGGPAKSILVREIDALGGAMAQVTDASQIQIRMLNTGKGPAVQALRAQVDKELYRHNMRLVLDQQQNLTLRQSEVDSLILEGETVKGVVTHTGAVFLAPAVVLTTGTYLNGKVILGSISYTSGPAGLPASTSLGNYLRSLGLPMGRFKTGTPARVDKNSLDFTKMKAQNGDLGLSFSFLPAPNDRPMVPCWLTYTNQRTAQIVRDNLHRSPLYSGMIEGIGPRYCPSFEDKVVRFAHREAHQLFLEPEGLATNEYYVQGMSSSLPEDVQSAFMRTIPGLENVVIIRPAYAIEYDCLQPTQLKPSLEHKEIHGFFSAGQINGTSGYEEAAAQGLLAGINAALYVQNKEPFVLSRAEAYIGVMVDDLVTKGVKEPYRLFTSLSEYRLLLRQDNADLRLTEKGMELGLVSEERAGFYQQKKQAIEKEVARLQTNKVSVNEPKLKDILELPLKKGMSLEELLRRPNVTYADIISFNPPADVLSKQVEEQVEIQIKYAGYIAKQLTQIERFVKLEKKLIPQWLDYHELRGLSNEAMQKLADIRPVSIGQAGRITGVSPADINVILIYLEQNRRRKTNNNDEK